MRIRLGSSIVGAGLALLSPVAFAAQIEGVQLLFNQAVMYGVLIMTLLFAVIVYFMRAPLDKRDTPLRTVLDGRSTVHSVAADVLVSECTRKMTDRKIGSVLVMDQDTLIGIFTERDALNRVLAAGRNPSTTKVCEVMTSNPYCLSPAKTVAEAMAVVTKRNFRHLPIVEQGKVSAVMSSRDLIHWLAKNKVAGIEEIIELAFGHAAA